MAMNLLRYSLQYTLILRSDLVLATDELISTPRPAILLGGGLGEGSEGNLPDERESVDPGGRGFLERGRGGAGWVIVRRT